MASIMGILRVTAILVSLSVGASGCATSAPSRPSSAPQTGTASGASASAAANVAFPLTLIDDAGRSLTLDAPAESVVSLAPSNTEIVCALQACDRLVGVTDFDDYPAQVAELPEVVVQTQVDVERVVEAEPDLVLAAGNELTPTAAIEQLDGLGVAVLVLYPESLEEVYADIELVGAALARDLEAATVIAEMRDRVATVEAAVDGAEAPRTLYEVLHAEGVTYTAGAGSFLASLIELAGGDPVTGNAEGVLAAEDLVTADPQLILLGTASYVPSLATREAALAAVGARAGWGDLSAVRDGNVVPYLEDIVTTRPGPRLVEGLEALARAIHPERFE